MEKKGGIPRRIPAMITYLQPFRMVSSVSFEAWSVSIDQINTFSWDYVKLHEIAGGIDVGLSSPYHMLVGRDGALALPPIPELRNDQNAVQYFNRCLAALLLGGIYCEAIRVDNLEIGSIIDWKYIQSHGGMNGVNRFHELIRKCMAPPIEAIMLESPTTLEFSEIQKAAKTGFAILDMVKQLDPELLLKGVSGIARRDWGLGLSNLWITIEQLTEALWRREFNMTLKGNNSISAGEISGFRESKTWTIANRHNFFHKKKIIETQILSDLYNARKARNELSHRGKHPDEKSAKAAYRAALALLQILVGSMEIPLLRLDIEDHSLSDPFKPRDSGKIEVKYWMAIPKLPGEEELEHEEAKCRSKSMQDRNKTSTKGCSLNQK